ncbi:hypothetical protein B0H14DRAFT_2577066 [Mycena olivaceomarginata]|nr:hypothetical protein B0H14DRAFT_2577066 [Mycena olivaceomarginata]
MWTIATSLTAHCFSKRRIIELRRVQESPFITHRTPQPETKSNRKLRVPASGVSTRIFLDINQSRTKEFLNFFPRKDKYLITPARRVIPPGATGSFTESIPRLLSSAEHGKVVIVVGKGEAPVSFTAVPDIAAFLPPSYRTIFSDSKAKGQVRTILACSSIFKLLDSRVRSTGWDEENQREKTGSDGAGSANPLWAGHSWKRIREVLNL